jgi:hypothetical protein
MYADSKSQVSEAGETALAVVVQVGVVVGVMGGGCGCYCSYCAGCCDIYSSSISGRLATGWTTER